MQGSDIEPFSPEEDEEEQLELTSTKKKKSSKNNKRRFSDEQVRSLETIFASETKLEPKKKVQVARELGLQPRQVAIWFQNKRARWKSKQIEKNYRVLKTNYDNLKARFEVMRKEKESLLEQKIKSLSGCCQQLQELRSLLERSHNNRSRDCKDFVANRQNMSRENEDHKVAALPAKSSGSLQEEMDHHGTLYSDDDKSGNMAYLGQEDPEFVNISENMDDSIVSPVKWCSFDAGNLFDQSSSNSHWWDSWT